MSRFELLRFFSLLLLAAVAGIIGWTPFVLTFVGSGSLALLSDYCAACPGTPLDPFISVVGLMTMVGCLSVLGLINIR
jgi:hypothetical protein